MAAVAGVRDLFGDAAGRQALARMQTTMNGSPGLHGSTFFFDAVAAAKARSVARARKSAGDAVGSGPSASSH
jgi:hypothetical protein